MPTAGRGQATGAVRVTGADGGFVALPRPTELALPVFADPRLRFRHGQRPPEAFSLAASFATARHSNVGRNQRLEYYTHADS